MESETERQTEGGWEGERGAGKHGSRRVEPGDLSPAESARVRKTQAEATDTPEEPLSGETSDNKETYLRANCMA